MKKFIQEDIFRFINLIFILITTAINVYGYFHLPEKIATQIGTQGVASNVMKKEIYLVGGLVIMSLLAYVNRKGTKENKIKYTLVNAIIMIANIIVIVVQLN